VVSVSTRFALGPSRPGQVKAENDLEQRTKFFTPYEASKYHALLEATKLAEAGAPIVTAIQTILFGPGPRTEGNHVAKVIEDYLKGTLRRPVGSGQQVWNFAWVQDVARGLVACGERGRIGERYLLGGHNVTLRDFMAAIAEVASLPGPKAGIPAPLVAFVGGLQLLRARATGRPPTLTPGVAAMYNCHWSFTSDRAVRELGYTITPFREALAQTVQWVAQQRQEATWAAGF